MIIAKVLVVVECSSCEYENDFEFMPEDLHSSVAQQCDECGQMIEVDVSVSVGVAGREER